MRESSVLIPEPDLTRFHWQEFTSSWELAPGIAYLNHGSFGPSPRTVRQARLHWSNELERNPVEFFFRRLDSLFEETAVALGRFVGCRPDNLVFVPNATLAMNIVAQNTHLAAGDEVLLNGHEYGAVIRIWGTHCRQAGARTVLARLPENVNASTSDYVEAIFSRVTPRTRLIVVSQVTSPTALILPVAEICQRARQLGIPVCVDGPHAVAMLPLELDKLGCEFYCASLHKWLSAPFGSGFLYVTPRRKSGLRSSVVSWGRSLSGREFRWVDEFHWSGTLDPAANLAVPDAIRFLEQVGLDRFRSQCHTLAQYAGWRLQQQFGAIPLASDGRYGTMLTLSIPQVARVEGRPGVPHPLQTRLAEEFQIEVPLIEWQDRMHIRVSCHLYNTPEHIDRLVDALGQLIPA
jgi:isopenicillin-N epimerase